MPKFQLKGGPFDGGEVEVDDPYPLRIELTCPAGPVGHPPGAKENVKYKLSLRYAVYTYFRGAGSEPVYRHKRG